LIGGNNTNNKDMSWILIACLAPALWALTNHIDKYLTTRFFANLERGVGALVIFTCITGLLGALIILIFSPNVLAIPLISALVLILSGVLLVLDYLPYMYAMQIGEASVVTSIYQTIPVFLYAMAFVVLGEKLSLWQIIGACLIIGSSVVITLEKKANEIKIQAKVFWLMLLASLLCSTSLLLFKVVAISENFWVSSFWEYSGWALTGLALFIFVPSYRRSFISIIKKGRYQVVSLGIFSEVMNIIAKILMNYAGLLAPLALVWVINGLQPFFVFLFAVIFTCFLPWFGKEKFTKAIVIQKLSAMLVMLIGLYLIGK